MIVSKLMGGLGNQMFQYAAGRALAETYNTDLFVDLRWFASQEKRRFLLNIFNVSYDLLSSRDVLRIVKPHNSFFSKIAKQLLAKLSGQELIPYQNEASFNGEFLFKDDLLYIEGYWQSTKYFEAIEARIRKDFSFKEHAALEEKFAKEIFQINHSHSVAVHARRGDYVTESDTAAHHVSQSPYYYEAAMRTLAEQRDGLHFFIFSDDIPWSEALFNQLPYPFTLVSSPTNRDFEDLFLMTECKHHIIANSSFSWWGAWLAQSDDQIVIAPKHWVRDTTKNQHINCQIPSHWRLVANHPT